MVAGEDLALHAQIHGKAWRDHILRLSSHGLQFVGFRFNNPVFLSRVASRQQTAETDFANRWTSIEVYHDCGSVPWVKGQASGSSRAAKEGVHQSSEGIILGALLLFGVKMA